MLKKTTLYILLYIFLPLLVFADDAWLVPLDDDRYRRSEEYFITGGVAPPYELLPLAAGDLKSQLRTLLSGKDASPRDDEINMFIDTIRLPVPLASPILALGLSGGYDSGMARFRTVPLRFGGDDVTSPPTLDDDPDNGLTLAHFPPFYTSTNVPSMITTGFIIDLAGFSLVFQPELRETNVGLLEENEFISVPEDLAQIDLSNPIPRYGMINFYSPHFEARLGRGKLQAGPGTFSTLSLARTMPFFDHALVRVRQDWFSFTATLVSLYPVISALESTYLDYLSANNLNPEPGAAAGAAITAERLKNYLHFQFTFRPLSWLSFSVTQTNLVGGRALSVADFNPFVSLVNLADQSYHCPLLLSSTVVPLPGIKIYAEFLFYDPEPFAWAAMGGFTLLSDPFFSAGPGRFRLDCEVTYVDPYCYGNFNDLIKFTSRFMYLEQGAPGAARYWVDYPLGFYLGPDCLDIHLALWYGRPGQWEAGLEWQSTAQGSVDLYGYGDDSDYLNHPADGSAPTGTAQWTHTVRVSFTFQPLRGLTFVVWYRVMFISNRFDATTRANIPGDNVVLHSVGASAVWKIF